MEAETSGHALWDCPNAREVWVSSSIPIQHHGLQFDAFIDLIWHLMLVQHIGDKLLSIIITLAWSIWHNRNAARSSGAQQTCTGIIQKAMLLLEEYQIANHKIKLPVAPHNVTWSPPSNSWYKINVNGVVFKQLQAIGIGVIAQDHEGQALAAMSKKLWVPLSPLEAKAQAMVESIIFA